MFCPKCGSIMMKKKCSCGYEAKDIGKLQITENVGNGKERKFAVVDAEQDDKILPETEAECPKCGNMKAYFWEVQTRAGDEPPTKFLKCTKCKHIWRDYS